MKGVNDRCIFCNLLEHICLPMNELHHLMKHQEVRHVSWLIYFRALLNWISSILKSTLQWLCFPLERNAKCPGIKLSIEKPKHRFQYSRAHLARLPLVRSLSSPNYRVTLSGSAAVGHCVQMRPLTAVIVLWGFRVLLSTAYIYQHKISY